MSLLEKLETRFGRWAIPHLSWYLAGLQALGALLLMGGYTSQSHLLLNGGLVRVGEWYRLFSFLLLPPTLHPLLLAISLYIFCFLGESLEAEWGAFRYNLFLLTAYLLTVLAALLFPTALLSNLYLFGTVFFAFATLFPEKEFLLFFIIPARVKWLGWLTAAMYFYVLATGDLGDRLGVAAAFCTYLLFFGPGFRRAAAVRHRRLRYEREKRSAEAEPLHVCSVCGATDTDRRDLEFRYCSRCGKCFCLSHLEGHDCRKEAGKGEERSGES